MTLNSMIDWGLLISGIIGVVAGGGASWVFMLKENKAGSQADVIDKAADAMKKLLDNAEQQQITFNKIIDGKDRLIEQQRGLIDEYKLALEEANQKLKTLEYRVADNNRKITGMQRTIDSEIKERKIAESSICFVNDCELRKPNLGTYKKEI